MRSAAAAMRELVGRPGTKDLVLAYFTHDNGFAGLSFDLLQPNRPDAYESSDIVAFTLLDVSLLPSAVRALLESEAEAVGRLVSDIPDDVDLWEASPRQLAPAYALWKHLRALEGVGPTRASKLMARKRPRLIPVVDDLIRREFMPASPDTWLTFQEAFRDGELRAEVEALRPEGLSPAISTLRLFDVAAWMHLSGSERAKKHRGIAGA